MKLLPQHKGKTIFDANSREVPAVLSRLKPYRDPSWQSKQRIKWQYSFLWVDLNVPNKLKLKYQKKKKKIFIDPNMCIYESLH